MRVIIMPLTLTEQEKALEQAKQESGKTEVDLTFSAENIEKLFESFRQKKLGAASLSNSVSQPTAPVQAPTASNQTPATPTYTPSAATTTRRRLVFGDNS